MNRRIRVAFATSLAVLAANLALAQQSDSPMAFLRQFVGNQEAKHKLDNTEIGCSPAFRDEQFTKTQRPIASKTQWFLGRQWAWEEFAIAGADATCIVLEQPSYLALDRDDALVFNLARAQIFEFLPVIVESAATRPLHEKTAQEIEIERQLFESNLEHAVPDRVDIPRGTMERATPLPPRS